MYEKLMNFLRQKPEVYAPCTSKFWDDPHISKQMLKAHLEPEIDSASRKHSFIKKSAAWIAGLKAPEGSQLLDLGCGPGLYTELFAASGFTVTGIDLSQRSIEYARSQAALKERPIEYRCQNYLEIDYQEAFDIITLIYCDYGVLCPADRGQLLKRIIRALKPGGLFILDGFTEKFWQDVPVKHEISYVESGFWSPDAHVCLSRNAHYPETKNTLEQSIIITADECQCFNIWNQIFTKASMEKELRNAGFNTVMFFDDVCGAPLSQDNKTICAVARKAQAF